MTTARNQPASQKPLGIDSGSKIRAPQRRTAERSQWYGDDSEKPAPSEKPQGININGNNRCS